MAEKLPAFDLFVDATFFWRCSALLGRNGYTYQMIALEAFSLELHLKCLHRISKRSIDKIKSLSHKIQDSFQLLAPRDQKRIRAHFIEASKAHFAIQLSKERGFAVDIDSVLHRAEGLFAQARYRAEGALSKPARKKIGINRSSTRSMM